MLGPVHDHLRIYAVLVLGYFHVIFASLVLLERLAAAGPIRITNSWSIHASHLVTKSQPV